MLGNLAFTIPGGWEWIVILVVALLIFGSRLPEVGRSIGRGIVEFKKGLKGVKDELDEVDDDVKRAGEHDVDDDQPPRQLNQSTTAGETQGDKQQAKSST